MTQEEEATANDVIDQAIDLVQSAKNLALSLPNKGIDLGQEGIEFLNTKLDETIDFLQKKKG